MRIAMAALSLSLSLLLLLGCGDTVAADSGVEPDAWADPCAEYTSMVYLVAEEPCVGCAFGRMRAESVHDRDLR